MGKKTMDDVVSDLQLSETVNPATNAETVTQAATQTDGPSLLLTPKRAPRSTTTTARRKSLIAAERTLTVESSSPILITAQPPMETIVPLDIHPMPYTQPPKSGQFTFLSTSSSEPLYERRGPRTRTVQPVPVPNLTKKSRGRRVPTSPAPSQATDIAPDKPSERKPRKKNGRVYMCEVADCGKFFVRGEHLKRHVRSIHTHEKPFQCKHPGCSRYFNRHDNLLQHQKVHKDPSYVPASDNETQEVPPPTSSGPEFIPPLPPPPLSPSSHHHVFRSDSSVIMPNVTYNAFPSYVNGPMPTHEYVTNVAISDMRTAMPTSSHIHGHTHPESLRHDERFFQYVHPIGQPPMQISHHFTNNTNEHPGPIYFS